MASQPRQRDFATIPLRNELSLYRRGRGAQNVMGQSIEYDILISSGHWANITTIGGGERDADPQRRAEARFSIVCRYDSDIMADRWFIDENTGARFDIEHVQDVELRNEWQIVTCSQAVTVPESG